MCLVPFATIASDGKNGNAAGVSGGRKSPAGADRVFHRPVQSLPAGDSCATLRTVMLEWVGNAFLQKRQAVRCVMHASHFSMGQLAGQRLMVGFDGTQMNRGLAEMITDFKVGGLILFSRNLRAPEQIEKLCASAQARAAACGQPPLFIAIDQEGGTVARLGPPFTRFAGNASMRTLADAQWFARITAGELRSAGINMNMAPVLDVAHDDRSIMRRRAFGGDAQQVARMGAAVIDTLQQNGIMAVAKHFPGIGRTTLDSHLDLPDLDVDAVELHRADLVPFAEAVRRKVCGIMLSHIRYTGLDARWPASLSVTIARDILRRRMGFQGLVLTDDLDMGAICRYYDIETAVGRILAADIDVALICHQGPTIRRAFDCLVEQLENSAGLRQRGRESVRRILAAKSRFMRSQTE